MECPHCGKDIDEITVAKMVLDGLNRANDRMREKKEHITNYVDYEINIHLIKAFQEYVDEPSPPPEEPREGK